MHGRAPQPRLRPVAAPKRQGGIDFEAPDGTLLVPCTDDFELGPLPDLGTGRWKLSRFTCVTLDGDRLAARNPLGDCMLLLPGAGAGAGLMRFAEPVEADGADAGEQLLRALFARARLILPCDSDGRTSDETEPARRQWDWHELLFHSLSRRGRTEKPIGGVYGFQGDIPPQPALKPIPAAWRDISIELPKPDLAALAETDLPLSAAIEQRRSIRQYGIVPPSKAQLGEFLFRTARVRHSFTSESGEFAFRPYPGGGACYESEFYVTIDACMGIDRGFYYYDPLGHRLCRVAPPGRETEGILTDAYWSSGGQTRPQILLTLASRFNRFNWKYSSMSYAAQLKNVGVIYQTLYLVATSMGLAGCALGLGDSDRFRRLTGLDYLEEGSIGEFMLGRPL